LTSPVCTSRPSHDTSKRRQERGPTKKTKRGTYKLPGGDAGQRIDDDVRGESGDDDLFGDFQFGSSTFGDDQLSGEVLERVIRANPDLLMMGGYLAENIVMAKDLFRANFKGKVMGFAYGITPAFIDGAGKEASEGIFTIAAPSPASSAEQ